MAHNGLFIVAGCIGVINSLIFLTMALNRNQLYAMGKPAQDYHDDPDGERRRQERMRNRYLRGLPVHKNKSKSKEPVD